MSSSLRASLTTVIAIATITVAACKASVRDFGEDGAPSTGSSGTTGMSPATGTQSTVTQGPGSSGASPETTTTTTTGQASTSSSTVLLPQGAPCTAADGCASGFCIDGVCCDADCPQACGACSAAKKGSGDDGVCGPIGA